VGRVVEVGANRVTDAVGHPLRPGDRVYWTVSGPCGRCYACTVLRNQLLCTAPHWPAPADVPNAAGFREYATIDSRLSVFHVPDETPSSAVIAFGCAMPTALGGFRKIGPIAPGATIVVQGAGPVGLACTMLAGLAGAEQVIVVGEGERRLDAASRLGATTVLSLDLPVDQREAAVRELTDGRGAEIVIEAAGHVSAFPEGLSLVARTGATSCWASIQGQRPCRSIQFSSTTSTSPCWAASAQIRATTSRRSVWPIATTNDLRCRRS